jgi:hypothetical protein
VPLDAGALKAVFCLRTDTSLLSADDPVLLAPHDTVLLGQQVTTVSLCPPPGTSADLLVLTWKATSHEGS